MFSNENCTSLSKSARCVIAQGCGIFYAGSLTSLWVWIVYNARAVIISTLESQLQHRFFPGAMRCWRYDMVFGVVVAPATHLKNPIRKYLKHRKDISWRDCTCDYYDTQYCGFRRETWHGMK